MAANWVSLFMLVGVVWFFNYLINDAREKGEKRDAAAETAEQSEKQVEAKETAQPAKAEPEAPMPGVDSLAAEMNKDPRVVIPFRGGPETKETEAEPVKSKTVKPKKRMRKVKADKLQPMPAVFSESSDWSMYEEPTVLRHHPDWAPPQWEPETTDQALAEMVPEEQDHGNVIVIQEWEDYRKVQEMMDNVAIHTGFFRDRNNQKVPLSNQTQLELPLKRH